VVVIIIVDRSNKTATAIDSTSIKITSNIIVIFEKCGVNIGVNTTITITITITVAVFPPNCATNVATRQAEIDGTVTTSCALAFDKRFFGVVHLGEMLEGKVLSAVAEIHGARRQAAFESLRNGDYLARRRPRG